MCIRDSTFVPAIASGMLKKTKDIKHPWFDRFKDWYGNVLGTDVYKRQEYDGPVFGASAIECGHYENLSLDEAKKECRAYLKVLESQTRCV